jgi:membrane protein DedA with SNARE-associated domain
VDVLLHDIIPLLLRIGPWLLFAVVAAETAIFLGLLIPAEATVLLAGFLVSRGHFELGPVLVATIGGAFVGDQIGYGLGRFYGHRVAAREGWSGRLWRRYEGRVTALFIRRAIVAVTLVRFLSFVRTLTPWFAGMSRLDYRRFLFYNALGVIGWGAASVAAGYLAGASWRMMAGAIGTATAAILLVLALTALLVALRRRSQAACIESA